MTSGTTARVRFLKVRVLFNRDSIFPPCDTLVSRDRLKLRATIRMLAITQYRLCCYRLGHGDGLRLCVIPRGRIACRELGDLSAKGIMTSLRGPFRRCFSTHFYQYSCAKRNSVLSQVCWGLMSIISPRLGKDILLMYLDKPRRQPLTKYEWSKYTISNSYPILSSWPEK